MAILRPATHPCARAGRLVFPSRIFRAGARLLVRRWTWLAILLAVLGGLRVGAQPISHEYELKAVLIYNFAQYTDWPTNAFESVDSPFVIGILGNDPFGGSLETTVENETIAGRTFLVKHFSTVAEIQTCHILYIGQSETKRLGTVLAGLKGRPILTLSDIENSAYAGVCVRFLTVNNKIRLRINVDSLSADNLVMSSKILRLAEIVPAKTP
jgi:hypothetical protein